jgi:hypothetical protein
VGRRRDVGVEAARRLKEILRQGVVPQRSLPPVPPPPSFEERRPLKFLRRAETDDDS